MYAHQFIREHSHMNRHKVFSHFNFLFSKSRKGTLFKRQLSTQVLIDHHEDTVSPLILGYGTAISTWSSKPREGLVPSIYWSGPGNLTHDLPALEGQQSTG